MRTTLTLDDDVAHELDLEVRRSGRSFKEAVNDLLRRALRSRERPAPRKRFVVRARDLRRRPGVEYQSVSSLLEQIEGPTNR